MIMDIVMGFLMCCIFESVVSTFDTDIMFDRRVILIAQSFTLDQPSLD